MSRGRVVAAAGSGALRGRAITSLAVLTPRFYHARRRAARPVESRKVKIALAQINPTVGDFDGNRRLVLEALAAAEAGGAQRAPFPGPAARRHLAPGLPHPPPLLAAALGPRDPRGGGRGPG